MWKLIYKQKFISLCLHYNIVTSNCTFSVWTSLKYETLNNLCFFFVLKWNYAFCFWIKNRGTDVLPSHFLHNSIKMEKIVKDECLSQSVLTKIALFSDLRVLPLCVIYCRPPKYQKALSSCQLIYYIDGNIYSSTVSPLCLVSYSK